MPDLSSCTHGADCKVHPDATGLHDFTPTAAEALRRARTLIDDTRRATGQATFTHAEAVAFIEQVADDMGLDLSVAPWAAP